MLKNGNVISCFTITFRSVAFAADSLYPIIHRPAFSHVRYLTQQPPTSHMWSHHMRPALTAPAHSLIRATTVSGVPVPIVRTNPAGFINPGLQEHISLEMKQGSLNPRESDTPSPQVLAQHHRMGSDDLLADEPMDRSYSDEEGMEMEHQSVFREYLEGSKIQYINLLKRATSI